MLSLSVYTFQKTTNMKDLRKAKNIRICQFEQITYHVVHNLENF